jgi:hypothetical protein
MKPEASALPVGFHGTSLGTPLLTSVNEGAERRTCQSTSHSTGRAQCSRLLPRSQAYSLSRFRRILQPGRVFFVPVRCAPASQSEGLLAKVGTVLRFSHIMIDSFIGRDRLEGTA